MISGQTNISLIRQAATSGLAFLITKLSGRTEIVCSLIITTRDKASHLNLTLASLERQTIPKNVWEVLVIDEASQDETPAVLDAYKLSKRLNLTHLRSEGRCNRTVQLIEAIAVSKGQILVFLSDDCLAQPDYVLQHLLLHSDEESIVLVLVSGAKRDECRLRHPSG